MAEECDPLVVDALVQRYPVIGANTSEKKQAARMLAARGNAPEYIALILREDRKRVSRWLDGRGRKTLCRNGLHQMTEDNTKMHRGQKKCLACHRDWKRRARKRYREREGGFSES